MIGWTIKIDLDLSGLLVDLDLWQGIMMMYDPCNRPIYWEKALIPIVKKINAKYAFSYII